MKGAGNIFNEYAMHEFVPEAISKNSSVTSYNESVSFLCISERSELHRYFSKDQKAAEKYDN